jgi:hypothetical protein
MVVQLLVWTFPIYVITAHVVSRTTWWPKQVYLIKTGKGVQCGCFVLISIPTIVNALFGYAITATPQPTLLSVYATTLRVFMWMTWRD